MEKIIFLKQNFKNYDSLSLNNKFSFKNNNNSYNNITSYKTLISMLNLYSNKTKQTNIIFADLYTSKSCFDKNAYMLFEYYLNNNLDTPYYIINNESDLYMSLLKQNKSSNLIIYNDKKKDFLNDLYNYLKDTKIIITSYSLRLLQIIPSQVSYIRFLKINHGIKHFKMLTAKLDIIESLGKKKNVICSSPFEYELLTKKLNYTKEQIHNASLVRYERFQFIKQNETKKKCILVSFTYRSYNKYIYDKSKYKINLENFLNDKELITYLSNKKIDLIYIPHHEEIDLGKNYSQKLFTYAKVKNQINLESEIERCSLYITDFSSIAFDFMFQNKPVLFFSIDLKDKFSFFGKNYMSKSNDTLYFGNYFSKKNLLIEKIKYYINNNFQLGNELKTKYESVFFFKKNIISKYVEIINNITNKKRI